MIARALCNVTSGFLGKRQPIQRKLFIAASQSSFLFESKVSLTITSKRILSVMAINRLLDLAKDDDEMNKSEAQMR